MSSNLVRRGRLSAMLGGVLWMVLRSLVLSTWDSTLFGFGYVFYNRMMVIPLLLLIAGAVSLWHVAGRGGRWGVAIVVLGLAASLGGVMVEFWWAGGLSGNREGAMLGWGIYGLGLLGQAIGLAVFAFGALRAPPRVTVPLLEEDRAAGDGRPARPLASAAGLAT